MLKPDCSFIKVHVYRSFFFHEIQKGTGQSSCIHEAAEKVQSQDIGKLMAMRMKALEALPKGCDLTS